MRSPDRIELFVVELGHFWREYCPDWRFMQLLCNFQRWLGYDGFYLEDDKCMERFEKYFIETFGRELD